ncbi:MAG: DUF4271 domain-containing protein [Cyclobacteriaceae bacterium]|nr:DUF4271 domain-containing protein [Cyclobacteriaceae bacterium]
MKRFLTFSFVLFLSLPGISQRKVIQDLRQDWQVQRQEKLEKYSGQQSKTIYFVLDRKAKGSNLVIHDRQPFSLFINGTLTRYCQDSLILPVDSLWTLYRGKLFLAVHQEYPIYSLQTLLVSQTFETDFENLPRSGHFFSDFVIIASLLILIALIGLLRVNTGLTLDYLNIIKLFSLKDRDESTVASRIGASINLFFFVLISFFLGLVLMIIFNITPERVPHAENFVFDSLLQAFLRWILLSTLILALLAIKLILIASFSLLFGLRDSVRFQFFNFVRLLFVTTGLMACLAVIYFIFHTQSHSLFYSLLTLGGFFIGIGTLFLFLKLLARSSLPIFHLFSYLCATEIIPLMILGRVILF